MQDELEEAIKLDVRKKIYNTINVNPGLHFREIQRRTEIATGALQYHLEYLQKKHLLRNVKEGKFVRFYSIRGKQLGEDQKLMNVLRQNSLRKIIVFLIQKKKASNSIISRNIGLSLSTTFWHLNKLVKEGVIEKKQKGGKAFFIVSEPDRIATLLKSYQRGFLDNLVDNFVEVWDDFDK